MKHTIEPGPTALAWLARMERIMADLTTAISDLTAAVSANASELTQLVADLKAAIAANNPTAIQAAADAIEAQVQALNAATAAAKAADPAQNHAACDTPGGELASGLSASRFAGAQRETGASSRGVAPDIFL